MKERGGGRGKKERETSIDALEDCVKLAQEEGLRGWVAECRCRYWRDEGFVKVTRVISRYTLDNFCKWMLEIISAKSFFQPFRALLH